MNGSTQQQSDSVPGWASWIAGKFLDGQLSILFIISALCLGTLAIVATPREEEPQIVVPIADIFVQFPGAEPEEVERLVATPLERLLWQIDGVEYVYSVAQRGMAVVTVRFYVGEDRERSWVKLHNKISSNLDQVPSGVAGWVVRPIEIDDVPIVTIALHGEGYDDAALRRIAEETQARLDTVRDVSKTQIVGGRRREARVEMAPRSLSAHGVAPIQVEQAIRNAGSRVEAGVLASGNQSWNVVAGPFLESVEDIESLIVGVAPETGNIVYLRDVAEVIVGPEEPGNYTRISIPGSESGKNEPIEGRPAVTIAVAKKTGVNAVSVAENVIAKMRELQDSDLPSGVEARITRNYGATADQKVNELLSSLGFAMVIVIGLLVFALGWREGLVVALAVPLSFALALFVNYTLGYTINRVTLFALILTLGLVVDDPITNVDNIERRMRLAGAASRRTVLVAVQEVATPVVMSTFTVIVSFLPMFFITGMMGPYMQPMASNVPLTVTFSTIAALTVTPWAAYHLLKGKYKNKKNKKSASDGEAGVAGSGSTAADSKPDTNSFLHRAYRAILRPLLESSLKRGLLLGGVVLALGLSGVLVLLRWVPMKMLPFDNKNELQLVVDFPEDTPLEKTDAGLREFERYLWSVPEVVDFETYTGIPSAIDFNGMVRHYYFRTRPNLGEIRINLTPKDERDYQSHEIALRIRKDLEAIAEKLGADLAIVESPPGPPVIATVVAEIYGDASTEYSELVQTADQVEGWMKKEPGLVDIQSTTDAPRNRWDYVVNREKAALHGVNDQTLTHTLALALKGSQPGALSISHERNPMRIQLVAQREERSSILDLEKLQVPTATGEMVELAELGSFESVPESQPIYHKNLQRVVYVMAEMAGRAPGEAILDLGGVMKNDPAPKGIRVNWAGEGEWFITIRVFRDLGLAFGAAMIGIYILLVVQTKSFLMPMVIMSAIPMTAIGVMPGFWILNLILDRPVGGFDNPVFFTATAMIGMIALGGIVVRNSIVLIEFIQDSIKSGESIQESILFSGAVRMRPILLTAATTALGAWPITYDPIFSGLAWALIFGLFASTAFTLVVVPTLYGMIYGGTTQKK